MSGRALETVDTVRAAEVVAAACLATDLGMGFPFEHGLHATLMAMRLADVLEVDRKTASQTYFCALLMYSGCTTDADVLLRIIGGSATESGASTVFGSPLQALTGIARAVPSPDAPPHRRAYEVVTRLLFLAAGAGFLIGKPIESIAVLIVVVVNTAVGTVTELRAVRSMEALSALAASITEVERDDRRDEIDAVELVPGDIVGVEAGDQVPADLRLIEAVDLTVEESALTGESVPVTKAVDVAAADSGLGDRHNMLFMGTTVRAGRGRGVVVATGSATEVGKVATMVDQAEGGRAPLQEGLERLGRILSLVVVALAGALAVLGLARGLPVDEVLEVAIALAVAIVPEGLPAVATLTLTVGMRRMAKDNALVRRLPSRGDPRLDHRDRVGQDRNPHHQ